VYIYLVYSAPNFCAGNACITMASSCGNEISHCISVRFSPAIYRSVVNTITGVYAEEN